MTGVTFRTYLICFPLCHPHDSLFYPPRLTGPFIERRMYTTLFRQSYSRHVMAYPRFRAQCIRMYSQSLRYLTPHSRLNHARLSSTRQMSWQSWKGAWYAWALDKDRIRQIEEERHTAETKAQILEDVMRSRQPADLKLRCKCDLAVTLSKKLGFFLII